MFKKLVPLDKKKHAALKINKYEGVGFAADMSYCFLTGSEVALASKTYPIVFPEKTDKNMDVLPMALFSFTKDGNQFVGKNGQWKADYIPRHIRRYPFIFAAVPEQNHQYALMIDEEAPMVNKKSGTPLFDKDGKAGPIITKAKDFLGKFQKDIEKTRIVMAELEEKGVLVPKQFSITQGKKKNAVRGFRVVDVKKLEALDDATLAKWVRNGLMGIIFSHLNSFTNLKKVAQAQGAVEK